MKNLDLFIIIGGVILSIVAFQAFDGGLKGFIVALINFGLIYNEHRIAKLEEKI